MNSREQFEAWHKGLKAMLIAAGEPTAARHCENLKVVYENAWMASREAIKIELPRAACYAGYDNEFMMIADDVREAIADAGLKVKANGN